MSIPMICPNCRKLISADEPACPYCRLSHPGSRWRQALLRTGLLAPERIVKNIITLNVVVYALSLLAGHHRGGYSMNPLMFLSPSSDGLLLLGASGTGPINQLHRWWSLLSANYLHGSLMHIFFNMAALSNLGPFVVREYGSARMFTIYTLGGVAGFAVSYVAGIRLTIGASAAVMALIGAAMYYGKSRGGGYGQAVYRQLWGWAVGTFVFGFLFPGINNWAHGGGLAAGFLLGNLLGYQEREREKPWHRTLGVGCMVATVGVLLWAAGTTVFYRWFGA